MADDINANLHPHLLDLLLQAFTKLSINANHAQLIFSSSEIYLLSPVSQTTLEPEHVWFTDRADDGDTSLTIHASFAKLPDANVQKRYLSAKYDMIVAMSPSIVEDLVTKTGGCTRSPDRQNNQGSTQT